MKRKILMAAIACAVGATLAGERAFATAAPAAVTKKSTDTTTVAPVTTGTSSTGSTSTTTVLDPFSLTLVTSTADTSILVMPDKKPEPPGQVKKKSKNKPDNGPQP